MELERQVLHKNREVGRAFSQMTLDDDYNLPDFKPDLTKVIKERGKIHLDEIHVNNGHVWFKGVLEFDILYRTDLDSRKINCLNGEISFQESLSIDGTEELDPVKVEGRIEDISVSVINSRKLGIRSLVEFTAVAEKPEETAVLTGVGDNTNCEIETEQMDVLELITDKKDTLRIRKEIALLRASRRLIDNGADLVLGNHPHVLQPREVYKGKAVLGLSRFFGSPLLPVPQAAHLLL